MRLFRALFTPADPMRRLSEQIGTVSLPFEIRPVATVDELLQVAGLRQAGYRSQRPADQEIDLLDWAAHAVVLGAYEKASGQLLGSMRVLLGSLGDGEISRYVNLPSDWKFQPCAEARLLCVARSAHQVGVKILLCKALYELALLHDCGQLVIASRRALQGFYRLMYFDDIVPEGLMFTPPGTAHSHLVLGLRLDGIRERWRADPEMAAFYRVVFEQYHPDLVLPADPQTLNPLSALFKPVRSNMFSTSLGTG
ncbi:MAG: hypothetical protein WA888_24550 [Burkholderiaceae bacterium]